MSAAPPDTSREREARLADEQVRQACAQLRGEGLTLLGTAVILGLMAWPRPLAMPLAGALVAAAVSRVALPRSRSGLTTGAALAGLAFGLAYLVLLPSLRPAEQTFLAMILVGLAAGGLLRLAVLPEAGLAWILMLLAPPVARHLGSQERGDLQLALLLFAYVGVLLVSLRRLSRTRRQQILLGLDRDDLADDLRRARDEQREAEAGLAALIEQTGDLLVVVAPDGGLLFASPALQRLLDAQGATRFIEIVHAEDRGALLAAQHDLWEGRAVEVPLLAFRVARADQGQRELEGSARLLTSGRHRGAVVLAARDVTQRNEVVQQLARKEGLLRALLEAAPDPIFYKDVEGRYLGCNEAFARVVGRKPGEITGLTDADIHPADVAARATSRDREALATGQVVRDEYWMELPDGRRVLLDTVKSPFRDEQGRPAGNVGICRDITELKHLEDRLRQAASTDALTGLMNRRRLDEVLAEEWSRARRLGEPLSVLMADVDHFKAYNDALGHGAGDLALTTVASLIRRCVARPGDVVARYGGEEFTLVLPHTGPAGAMAVAGQVLDAVRRAAIPHPASASAFLTLSVGVASAVPKREQPLAELLAAADAALYEAKDAGRNTVRARDLR